ncbi:MAG: DUF805 domain-containing protein [Bacteroidales bacterium]|nr:DUF805 domain-containing protein [Bacteroidales bacterium]
MGENRHLDSYKPPASSNEEKLYFLTYGRIRRRAFFLRTLLVFSILIIANLIMENYFNQEYYRWQNIGNGVVRNQGFLFWYNVYSIFNYFVLTILLVIFFIVQSTKRIHDVNKSGWYVLVPFYNIILWLSEGDKGQNDYGLDPKPYKVEKYYDNTLYQCSKCNHEQVRRGMKECPNCNTKLSW